MLPPAILDRLAGVTIASRRPVAGAAQGGHRANRHGAAVEFSEYRAWNQGDPPALIDWKAYARSDRLLIKRFEAETSLTAWVVLDVSQSMGWGGAGRPDKLSHGATLAAALAAVLVGQGDRCGGLLVAEGVRARHAPAGTVASLQPLLKALDAARPTGRGDVAAAMEGIADELPRRGLVLVIGDLLQPAPALLRAAAQLHARGHDLRVLHIVDRGELDVPGAGLAELEDLETGERIEADLDELRAAWQAAVARHHDELRRGLQGLGARYILADTAEDPVRTVMKC